MDFKTYLKPHQRPKHKRQRDKQGPIPLPKILRQYSTSFKHSVTLGLKAEGRSKSSQNQHNRVLTKISQFLSHYNEDLLDLTVSRLEEYLNSVEENQEKFSYIKTIPGAIEFLMCVLSVPELWSRGIKRLYQGILNRSAIEKPPVQKAPLIPAEILEKALLHHIIPHMYGSVQV